MAVDPTWDEVENRLATLKTTTAIALSTHPTALVLVDPAAQAIGLIATAGSHPPAAAVRIARGIRLQPHGPAQTAVWVDEAGLLKPGLEFLLAVSRGVLGQGETTEDAVDAQLESWRDLVAAIAETEGAAAVGVLGELALLRAALELNHDVSCWVGMAGGAIDFRFGELEFEVKTTTGSLHEHIIHGEGQLQPSVGADLVLVSIVIAPAEIGHGTSINDLITDIAAHGVKQSQLEADLLSLRKVSVADPVADRPFVLRVPPLGFVVDGGVPAITSSALRSLFGQDAARIREVNYRLRFDGLPVSADPTVAGLIANVRL
jgi:hypothetical protein